MINLQHVSFGYIKQQMLLIDTNLKIDKGSLFVFGQEGAGKTSLLELLCGMQSLYVGKISVYGELPQDATCNITYLPSKVVALNNKTVLQNMQYACDAINKDYNTIDLTDDFIKEFGNKKFKKLSNFNRAIFALKRAEIKDAKVLLLDINLTGFTNEEIKTCAQILQELLLQKNKIVVIAISAEDFKKLQIHPQKSEICYIFATKTYKFANWQNFSARANFMGMADYLPLKKYNATISVSQSGIYLKVLSKTIKIDEKYIKKIAEYFDEITTSTNVKIYTNLDIEKLSDQEFNDCLKNQLILLYDALTTEKLN